MSIRFQNIKTKFHQWFIRWRACLPIIAVGAVMFFTSIGIGGRGLAGIPIAMMFVMGGLLRMNVSVKVYLSYYAVLTLCALLGVIATMNYALCLILNFVIIFLITYVNGDHYVAKNHFMYGFLFIMPQMQPLEPVDLLRCLALCSLCFFLMSLYIIYRKKRFPSPGGIPYIIKACSRLADLLASGILPADGFHLLLQGFSHDIYADTTKQFGKMSRGQTWRFHVLLYMEQLEHLYREELERHGGEPSASAYFQDLAHIFQTASQKPGGGSFRKFGENILSFLETHSLDEDYSDQDWRLTLGGLAGELIQEEVCLSQRVSIRNGIRLKLRMMKQDFHLDSSILRFALKAAILITACFAVSYPMPFSKSYWLPLTVYSMLMVFHQDEKSSASSRLLGTMLGMLFFVSITEFLPGPPTLKMLIMMFLGFSLIFSFSDLKITMLIGTQMSIGSLFPTTMSIEKAVSARFLIILAATAIVWVGGQLIFRTERLDVLKFHMRSLLHRYRRFIQEVENLLCGKERSLFLDELLLTIQMNTDEIESLAKAERSEKDHELNTVILPSCRAFYVEMVHMLLICNLASLPIEAVNHFNEEIEIMKRELDGLLLDDSLRGERKKSHTHSHMAHSTFHLHNLLDSLREGHRHV